MLSREESRKSCSGARCRIAVGETIHLVRGFLAIVILCLHLGSTLTAFAVTASTTLLVRPGVRYTQRVDKAPMTPQEIHILEIDLDHPAVTFETGLGGGAAIGRETVPDQVSRTDKGLAGINADFSGFVGSTQAPQNICVQNGELITTPNFRTAVGIGEDHTVRIGFWNSTAPPSFSWQGFVRDEEGNTHAVIQQNQDLNPGWLGVVTERYVDPPFSRGGEFEDEVEALIGRDGTVQSIHDNTEGIALPEGGWVLVGRTTAGQWIQDHLDVGERIVYGENSSPDWRDYPAVVGGGPRVVVEGVFHADPVQAFNRSNLDYFPYSPGGKRRI